MSDSLSRAEIVMSILATGVYRTLFWQSYNDANAQYAWKQSWQRLFKRAGYSTKQIKDGLIRWEQEKGKDVLPQPNEFEDFMRPKHTEQSRRFFDDARCALKSE